MVKKSTKTKKTEKVVLSMEPVVVWALWRININRLFNAKSIFMQIVSSISNNSV